MTKFQDLGLAPALVKTVAAEGYEQPTPIQAKAIPVVLQGRDLIGLAQTGTGKTAAFALPILHRLAADRRPLQRRACRVLVLSPTRELATQIGESFATYGAGLGLSQTVVFGGVKHGPQMRAMAPGVDILVACPGRLLDHVAEQTIDLSKVEIFVLDEADQMLDLGFFPAIKKVVRALPRVRQNLFFSATMAKEIRDLAGELVKDPAEVAVAPAATTAEKVVQQVLFVEQPRKRALLAELFSDPGFTRTLVFARTKHGADRLARYLESAGVEAAAIHGDKSQGQRERALAAFKAGELRALVATDIAARGIDVDKVSHVVNFDLPNVPEAYVHRIGRTARAGAGGHAVSLVCDEERNLLKDIQKLTRQTIPSFDRRNDKDLARQQAVDAAVLRHQGKTGAEADVEAGRGPRPDKPSGRPKHRRRPGAKAKPGAPAGGKPGAAKGAKPSPRPDAGASKPKRRPPRRPNAAKD
jgi:ATP-dependent RNA helicase RhlE